MTGRQSAAGFLFASIVLSATAFVGGTGQLTLLSPLAPHGHGPRRLHRRREQTVSENYNWSGYAVTAANGAVSDVKGSWIVPASRCSGASGTPTGYSSFWVGIDGWTDTTVEQIGTDSDCVSPYGVSGTPTYYAWFEFYPQSAYYIGNPGRNFSGFTVKPGDVMTAEVKATGANPGGRRTSGPIFTTTISDIRGGVSLWSFSTSATVRGALQSSAEWIAETPEGCNTPGRLCPLANFGVVDEGSAFTAVPGTSYATVGGKALPIGSFGNNLEQAVMVSYPSGSTVMASPSALFPDLHTGFNTSFFVNWLNVGP